MCSQNGGGNAYDLDLEKNVNCMCCKDEMHLELSSLK